MADNGFSLKYSSDNGQTKECLLAVPKFDVVSNVLDRLGIRYLIAHLAEVSNNSVVFANGAFRASLQSFLRRISILDVRHLVQYTFTYTQSTVGIFHFTHGRSFSISKWLGR